MLVAAACQPVERSLPDPPPSDEAGPSATTVESNNPGTRATVAAESPGPTALADGSSASSDQANRECTPGAVECVTTTSRHECDAGGRWLPAATCPFACDGGACTGECRPDTAQCTSSSEKRRCGESGLWAEAVACNQACVDGACAGSCKPGETRCASSTTVQICDERGEWGVPTACMNACTGTACTGECPPATTRCFSSTQVQTCNEQGQWQTPANCDFACADVACGGVCRPAARRCDPDTGAPQVCNDSGVWQSQDPCPFVCVGSGSCGGECVPTSRRCSPSTGLPQLCSASATWQNQAACQFVCAGSGTCSGECVPGTRRCNPTSGVPELCSPSGGWLAQAPCAGQCQNGACAAPLSQQGTACSQNAQCASGACSGGVCCEFDCASAGRTCNASGACVCPSGRVNVGGACLLADGQPCQTPNQCASSQCSTFFRDADGDGHGDPASQQRLCGDIPVGFNAVGDDCCDQDAATYPQPIRLPRPAFAAPNACGSFDRNCDRVISRDGELAISRLFTACAQIPFSECVNVRIWVRDENSNDADTVPACGAEGTFIICHTTNMGVATGSCGSIAGAVDRMSCF
jgi:hypothetical protein